jgi:hypothetical protein
MRVFESSVAEEIFGPRGGDVIEGWTKLCNEELFIKYYCDDDQVK